MAIGVPTDTIVIALYGAPLLVAGVCDLVRYRIPNLVTAAIAAFFVVCALVWGVEVNWLSHAAAAAAVLAVGLVLFAFKWFGGGDIKLLTAVALWIGWGNDLLEFVLAVALLGGAISLVLVAVRYALSVFATPWQGRLPVMFQTGAAVPYGVAIVAVALWLTPHAPQFIYFR
jgi:prepilin peptidase CpaA